MERYSEHSPMDMYPEIFRVLYPHAYDVAGELGDQPVTEDLLEDAVPEVLYRSGIYEDAETAARFGRDRRRAYRRRDDFDLGDLARIILLEELFRRRRRW